MELPELSAQSCRMSAMRNTWRDEKLSLRDPIRTQCQMNPLKSSRLHLFLAAGAIVLFWQVPYGRQILYPLTLLATFAHEMGHGLTALLLGNSFMQMVMHTDGSGMATWSGSPGRINAALVAAGGLVGPSVAGSALLVMSRTVRGSKIVLAALAVMMVIFALVWVRNTFGLVFVLSWAATFAAVSRLRSEALSAFVVHIVALTLCLAIFSDINYMFSDHAIVAGQMHPSDSAQMAKALLLPYWFWGGVVAVFSLTVMAAGIWMLGRSSTSAPRMRRGG